MRAFKNTRELDKAAPGISIYMSLLDVLWRLDKTPGKKEIRQWYSTVIRRRLIDHWHQIEAGVMDVRKFNLAGSKTAVMHVLEELKLRKRSLEGPALVIVTGRGKTDKTGEANMKSGLLRFLKV